MRHSRRAVMTERYKLYAKKNIFNSRYLVRNVQIGLLAIALLAMIVGAIVLTCSNPKDEEAVVTNAKVSVKDALFSNSEEIETVVNEDTTERATESTEISNGSITEKVKGELDNTITEVANNVVKTVKEKKQEEQPKSEFDNKCIANVEETLNIRKDPSAEAEFVGSMNTGAIAIVQGTEGEWTKIKSGEVEGYVLTEYVLTGKRAEQFAKDYVTLCGTILEDGVNIRAEESTDAEILQVMNTDDTIIVLKNPEEESEAEDEIADIKTETEASDETTEDSVVTTEEITYNDESGDTYVIKVEAGTSTAVAEENTSDKTENKEKETEITEWVPVVLEDGRTGYVAADLIRVDELYEIAISAEELQRIAEEEEARKLAEEEAERQAATAQTTQLPSNDASDNISDNTSNDDNDVAYQGATTEPVTTTESGELIGEFTITAYCGCSKCSAGYSKTASGTTPAEGRTIAADTSILPFGTQVVIDGIVYTVEDCGSGVTGYHIDIFFSTHEKAQAYGRKTIKVYKY